MDSNGTSKVISDFLMQAKEACVNYEELVYESEIRAQHHKERAEFYALMSIAENLEKLVSKTGWLRTEK